MLWDNSTGLLQLLVYAVCHCGMIVTFDMDFLPFQSLMPLCVLCIILCLVLCSCHNVIVFVCLFSTFNMRNIEPTGTKCMICVVSRRVSHTHKHITSITRGIQFWFGYVFFFGLFIFPCILLLSFFSILTTKFFVRFKCRVDFQLSTHFDATPNTMPLYIQQYMKHDKHRAGTLLSEFRFPLHVRKFEPFPKNCEFVIFDNQIYRSWHRHDSRSFKWMSAKYDEPVALSIVNKTCDPIRIREAAA